MNEVINHLAGTRPNSQCAVARHSDLGFASLTVARTTLRGAVTKPFMRLVAAPILWIDLDLQAPLQSRTLARPCGPAPFR